MKNQRRKVREELGLWVHLCGLFSLFVSSVVCVANSELDMLFRIIGFGGAIYSAGWFVLLLVHYCPDILRGKDFDDFEDETE